MEENATKISIFTFIFKILAGTIGGLIGTVILLLIFIIGQSALSPLASGEVGDINTIFVFIIMIMVFISGTISNILSSFFLSLTERKKYRKKATAIYQIFIANIIIFLLSIPVYLITSAIDISLVATAVALHLIISAQASALILEIVSNYRHALVGVYGVIFSTLISAVILFALVGLVQSPAILLFAALPVVWASIAFTQGLVASIYNFIATTYDRDFLAADTLYGKDYGKQTPKKENEDSGANFLRKSK